MDELRVKVKITNAIDEALARRGEITLSEVRTCDAVAIVDLNVVSFVLPRAFAKKLGLVTIDKRFIKTAFGQVESVDVMATVAVKINGRDTIEEALIFGDEILVGRTVLAKTDLHIDAKTNQVVGNPAHPDQPVLKVK